MRKLSAALGFLRDPLWVFTRLSQLIQSLEHFIFAPVLEIQWPVVPMAMPPLLAISTIQANPQSTYSYSPATTSFTGRLPVTPSPHLARSNRATVQPAPLADSPLKAPATTFLRSRHDTHRQPRRPYTPVCQPQGNATTHNQNGFTLASSQDKRSYRASHRGPEHAAPANHAGTTYPYPPAEHVLKKVFVSEHSAQPEIAFGKSLRGHKTHYTPAIPQSSQHTTKPPTPVPPTKVSSSQYQQKHQAPGCERPVPVQTGNTADSYSLAKSGVAMEFVPKDSVHRAKVFEPSLFARNDMPTSPRSCQLGCIPLSELWRLD
ncbi:hypothetical protein B0J17DRAFT_658326 [Rhizoctonia solani]|nr:hypothetical protein B0J17DRAFT_658326 [Rhizoctonia solani]